MSYDIYIGEAECVDLDGQIEVRVRAETAPDAPTFPNDEMTGSGNSRHPGYGAWTKFCEVAGLKDLFFDDEEGLMREHPGTFALCEDHHARIREALAAWRAKYPAAVPGFYPDRIGGKIIGVEVVGDVDPVLARLIWLDFWVGRALAKCLIPAIHNH